MSIYEANSIPPHHVRSHIHSRAATSTSYLLFTCSSSWNRQQTISYILKNISYPALLPSTFPRPKTRKKSSPCRIVSTFENGAFDAPPRSIILSARQSRRDWVGGGGGGGGGIDRIGRISILALRQNRPIFCRRIRYIEYTKSFLPINACTCILHKVTQKPPLPPLSPLLPFPSSPPRIDSNKN